MARLAAPEARVWFFPTPLRGGGAGFQFATYRSDSASQFYYAQQRYYSSKIARFLTADPTLASNSLMLPQNWNRYAYVSGDAVNKTDPHGLCSPQDNPPCYDTTVTDPRRPSPGPDLVYEDYEHWVMTFRRPRPRAERDRPGPLKPWDKPPEYVAARTAVLSRLTEGCAGSGLKSNVTAAVGILWTTPIVGVDLGFAVEAFRETTTDGGYEATWMTRYQSAFFTGTEIQINANPALSNLERVPVGTGPLSGLLYYSNELDRFAVRYGLAPGAMTQTIYRSIFVLHEMRHALGQTHAEGESDAWTRDVIDNCFKDLKQ